MSGSSKPVSFVASLQNRVAELEGLLEIAQKSGPNVATEGELADLRASKKALESQLGLLEIAAARARDELETVREELNQTKLRMETLRSELDDEKRGHDATRVALTRTEWENKELERSVSQLSATNSKLQEDNRGMILEIANLKKDSGSESEALIRSLREDFQREQQRARSLSTDLSEQKLQNQSLLGRLQKDVGSTPQLDTKEIDRLNSEIEMLHAEVARQTELRKSAEEAAETSRLWAENIQRDMMQGAKTRGGGVRIGRPSENEDTLVLDDLKSELQREIDAKEKLRIKNTNLQEKYRQRGHEWETERDELKQRLLAEKTRVEKLEEELAIMQDGRSESLKLKKNLSSATEELERTRRTMDGDVAEARERTRVIESTARSERLRFEEKQRQLDGEISLLKEKLHVSEKDLVAERARCDSRVLQLETDLIRVKSEAKSARDASDDLMTQIARLQAQLRDRAEREFVNRDDNVGAEGRRRMAVELEEAQRGRDRAEERALRAESEIKSLEARLQESKRDLESMVKLKAATEARFSEQEKVTKAAQDEHRTLRIQHAQLEAEVEKLRESSSLSPQRLREGKAAAERAGLGEALRSASRQLAEQSRLRAEAEIKYSQISTMHETWQSELEEARRRIADQSELIGKLKARLGGDGQTVEVGSSAVQKDREIVRLEGELKAAREALERVREEGQRERTSMDVRLAQLQEQLIQMAERKAAAESQLRERRESRDQGGESHSKFLESFAISELRDELRSLVVGSDSIRSRRGDEEVALLTQERNRLNAVADQQSAECERLRSANVSLEDRVQRLEREISDTANTLVRVKKEKEKVEQSRTEATSLVERLRSELVSIKLQLGESEHIVSRLRTDADATTQSRREIEGRLTAAEAQLSGMARLQKDLQTAQSEVQRLTNIASSSSLTEDILKLRELDRAQERKVSEETIGNLNGRVSVLSEEIGKLEGKLKEKSEAADRLASQLQSAEKRVLDVERESARDKIELTNLRRQIDGPSSDMARIHELEKQASQLQEEVRAATQRSDLQDLLIKQRDVAESGLTELRSVLADTQSQFNKALGERMGIETERKELVNTIETLRAERDRLMRENGSLATKVEGLTRDMRDAKGQVALSDVRVTTLEAEVRRLIDENSKLKLSLSGIEEERVRERAEMERHLSLELQRAADEISRDREALTTPARWMAMHVEELERELETARTRADHSEAKIQNLTATVWALHSQLTQAQSAAGTSLTTLEILRLKINRVRDDGEEAAGIRDQVGSMAKLIQSLGHDRHNFEIEIQRLRQTATVAESKTEECGKLQDQLRKVTQELVRLTHSNGLLQGKSSEMSTTVERLEAELSLAKERIAMSAPPSSATVAEVYKLQEENSNLRQNIQRMQVEITAAIVARAEGDGRLAQANEDIATLRSRLSGLENEIGFCKGNAQNISEMREQMRQAENGRVAAETKLSELKRRLEDSNRQPPHHQHPQSAHTAADVDGVNMREISEIKKSLNSIISYLQSQSGGIPNGHADERQYSAEIISTLRSRLAESENLRESENLMWQEKLRRVLAKDGGASGQTEISSVVAAVEKQISAVLSREISSGKNNDDAPPESKILWRIEKELGAQREAVDILSDRLVAAGKEESVRKRLDTTTQDLINARAQITSLEISLAEAQTRSGVNEKKLAAMAEENGLNKIALSDTHIRIESLLHSKGELEGRVSELSTSLAKANRDIAVATSGEKAAQKMVSDAQSRAHELAEGVVRLRQELAAAKKQTETISTESRSAAIAQLRLELTTLRSQLELGESSLETATAKNEKLKKKLTEIEQARNDSCAAEKTAVEKLNRAESEIEILTRERERERELLLGRLTLAEAAVLDVTQRYSNAESRIREQEKDMERLVGEMDVLRQSFAARSRTGPEPLRHQFGFSQGGNGEGEGEGERGRLIVERQLEAKLWEAKLLQANSRLSALSEKLNFAERSADENLTAMKEAQGEVEHLRRRLIQLEESQAGDAEVRRGLEERIDEQRGVILHFKLQLENFSCRDSGTDPLKSRQESDEIAHKLFEAGKMTAKYGWLDARVREQGEIVFELNEKIAGLTDEIHTAETDRDLARRRIVELESQTVAAEAEAAAANLRTEKMATMCEQMATLWQEMEQTVRAVQTIDAKISSLTSISKEDFASLAAEILSRVDTLVEIEILKSRMSNSESRAVAAEGVAAYSRSMLERETERGKRLERDIQEEREGRREAERKLVSLIDAPDGVEGGPSHWRARLEGTISDLTGQLEKSRDDLSQANARVTELEEIKRALQRAEEKIYVLTSEQEKAQSDRSKLEDRISLLTGQIDTLHTRLSHADALLSAAKDAAAVGSSLVLQSLKACRVQVEVGEDEMRRIKIAAMERESDAEELAATHAEITRLNEVVEKKEDLCSIFRGEIDILKSELRATLSDERDGNGREEEMREIVGELEMARERAMIAESRAEEHRQTVGLLRGELEQLWVRLEDAERDKRRRDFRSEQLKTELATAVAASRSSRGSFHIEDSDDEVSVRGRDQRLEGAYVLGGELLSSVGVTERASPPRRVSSSDEGRGSSDKELDSVSEYRSAAAFDFSPVNTDMQIGSDLYAL